MDWESPRSKTILSADLSDLDRTMLVDGLLSSEADEDRLQTIICIDRRRRVVDDGFDELIDFVCISHHVALEEEEHRLLSDDAILAAVNSIGVRIVGDGDAALRAEDFSALVVAVDGRAAVVDNAHGAVGEFQGHHGGIHITGLAEIIEEVTGIEPSEVTPEKSFVDDLDIDSLSMVEIAVQTEDKYGVKIPDEDLAGLRTVGDVVAYIQKLEEENPEAAAALREKFAAE